MTVEEKLAELRAAYPGRIINVAPRMVKADEWTQQGYVATAHTRQCLGWKGGLIWGMDDLGVETIRPTAELALDALAEALARLEGKCPRCAECEEALAATCFDERAPVKVIPGDVGTVKGIVRTHLQLAGYDGLCTDDCGCELADLMPCAAADGSCCDTCVPGHKVSVDPEESELGRGWQIVAGKEAD